MLQGGERSGRTARKLRRERSLPEGLLWQRLKLQPHGFKFCRQHPAGPYVLDFCCHKARLVVEVDGLSHGMGGCPQADAIRDQLLLTAGLTVVRVSAADVLQDPDEVAASILKLVRGEET